MRPEHQCGWCMECHAEIRGEDQRRGGIRSKTDGGGPDGRYGKKYRIP